MRWVHPNYRHVYAMRKEGDYWIIVNPYRSYTGIELKPAYLYPDIRQIVRPLDEVMLVTVDNLGDDYRGHLCWFTCVEVVKSLLGIKAFWCFTPYQLYKRLNNANP